MADKEWKDMSDAEKRAKLREDVIKDLDWQLTKSSKTPEQIWFLYNKWDHDLNSMMWKPCRELEKGNGLTHIDLHTLIARFNKLRRDCGWK